MINNKYEFNEALKLMSELIEDYDTNIILIDKLWLEIEAYEILDPELTEFHETLKSKDGYFKKEKKEP